MSVPNQKKIVIERTSERALKDFLKVSNDNLYTAMYNLKGNTFKLWAYFVDNANGYTMDLYPIDFMSRSGVSKSTYDRSFKELEEKGYLKQSSKNKNYYLFSEYSNSSLIEHPDTVNSLDTDDFNEIKQKLFEE